MEREISGEKKKERIDGGEEKLERETEIFDGDVNGVAAVEEEADEPRADVAAPSGYAHYLSFFACT